VLNVGGTAHLELGRWKWKTERGTFLLVDESAYYRMMVSICGSAIFANANTTPDRMNRLQSLRVRLESSERARR
jgi:hypothetical protein